MEIGLKQVAAYVARWHETGRVPTIERDIVLERMQRIYAEIMQLRCTDGVAMQLAAARVEVEHVPATTGLRAATQSSVRGISQRHRRQIVRSPRPSAVPQTGQTGGKSCSPSHLNPSRKGRISERSVNSSNR